MNSDMILTFAILAVATLLFVTEWLRADLVALMVLVAVVVAGLISPTEAISGFSNTAVVTIWSIYILSAGLARTGVSTLLGKQIVRYSQRSEQRLITILMSSTAFISAIMNINGAAAMFLPVTIDIARRTKRSASRLLMPMAYGALIGGMLVLFGTASNLVVNGIIREAGLPSLQFFSFTPIGLVVLAVVLLYMNIIGHRLLPVRQTPQSHAKNGTNGRDLHSLYGIEERLAFLTIPANNPLVGKTIAQSRIGHILGMNVLRIERANGQRYSPTVDMTLDAGDRLLALGRLDQLNQLTQAPLFETEEDVPAIESVLCNQIAMAEFQINEGSSLCGQTLASAAFRDQYHVNVIAIRREERVFRTKLEQVRLQTGDFLLVEGWRGRLEKLCEQANFQFIDPCDAEGYRLEEHLLYIHLPEGSALAGKTLEELKLSAVYSISILTIKRGDAEWVLPGADTRLEEGDQMIISGHPDDIEALDGLRMLQIEPEADVKLAELEDDNFTIVEVIISPHGTLSEKTLQDLHFREKYDISVLAIWHGDRPYRTAIADLPMQKGDALLCYGRRERFEMLAKEPDFIVMRMDVQEKPRLRKAPIAAAIMLAVIVIVIADWLPIYIAAIGGASLMVITGCLTMDEAHQSIEWKAIFLIAAMLPLGLAIQKTGGALLLADTVINAVGVYGNMAILAGLMLMTAILNIFIPSKVTAVVMTPIALATAAELGVSPYPFIMGVAYMAAACFLTPVSHAANMLVMSPGGYRYTDYVKNGIPIALIVFVVSFLMMPFVFPF
jgi:di/tricarboxylate transporter